MKRILLFLIMVTGTVFVQKTFAINPAITPNGSFPSSGQITVNDFLSFDFKEYRTAEGKKLKWAQRISGRMMQKNLARQVKNGKIEGTASFNEAARASAANKTGRLSLIFSSLGLLFLFIPYLSLIGLGFSVAGFVLGILGLSRDEDLTMAVLGVVIGGLALLLYLIVIISTVAWFSWF